MIKTRLLFIFFVALFAAILVKLFYLQFYHPYSLSPNEYLKTHTLDAERGKIYDRNNQPLAVNTLKYRLYGEPKKIEDKNITVKALNSVLNIGEATLEGMLDPNKEYVAIQSRMDENKKNDIEKLKLRGLGFEDEYDRYYPEASLSAHIIGFVGKDKDGASVGYSGVEGFYDRDLAGLPGIVKTERDLLNKPILMGVQERIDSENGRDLTLTIDKSVQEIVKKKLVAGVEKYKVKDGCVIVANPNTMEILALSCLPDFDPNTYYTYSQDTFKNAAITDTYEPGSTFKPLVMAAAIEERAVKPDDIYDESGAIIRSGYTIRTWNDKYEGKISMTRILERSSNVGMVYVGEQLGNDKLYDYVRRLGFGNVTNIDLEGESTGTVKTQKQWYPIDYATVTFGQGIATTPLQVITAFSTLINGGNLMRPYVVGKTNDGVEDKVREPRVVRKVFSQKTSEIMKKMLYSTVEHGEFKWAKPEGYTFGGKTGTAQIAIGGRYDASKTIASFIGFAPVENPRFIALVILHEPGSSQWGSETAAPLFFEIAKDLLVYYNISPDSK